MDAFQRDEPILGIGAEVGEFGGELLDLIDDANPRRPVRGDGQRRMTEAGRIEVRIGEFDIDEMPLPGLLVMLAAPVAVGVPIPVSLMSPR